MASPKKVVVSSLAREAYNRVIARPNTITARTPTVEDVMPSIQPRIRMNPIDDVVILPKVQPKQVVASIVPINNNINNNSNMSLISKFGKWAGKTVGKATSFAQKVSKNPIGAASDLLQGGGASKSGTPKTSPIALSETGPSRAAFQQVNPTAVGGGIMQKAMNFIKTYWMYILGGFVVLFVVWWFFMKKKGSAARRRRTAPARAARARNRRRTPIKRRK